MTAINDSSFADRDMFARFAGIGVGHLTQNPGTEKLALAIDPANERSCENEPDMLHVEGDPPLKEIRH